MDEAQPGKLSGRRVLVVEDEFYLADDLRRELIDNGAEVIGPANTVERARALTNQQIDLAVLDVNLKGELVFPFADELRARGVPLVFTTGYEAAMIPDEYREVPRWEKPFVAHQLIRSLLKL